MSYFDFIGLLEILVIIAISIELYELYKRIKLDRRLDEHIRSISLRLEKSDEIIKLLDKHMLRLDDHMNKVNEYATKLIEQMNKH